MRSLFSLETPVTNNQSLNSRCININITVNHNYISNLGDYLPENEPSFSKFANTIFPDSCGSPRSTNYGKTQSQFESVDETCIDISTFSTTERKCIDSNSISIAATAETEAKVKLFNAVSIESDF